MSSRVYVVQERPQLDIRSAESYGEIHTIFYERDQLYDPDAAVKRILYRMPNFTDSDYILAIGHPVGISLVAAAAARLNGGRFKMLIWHPDNAVYYSVQMDLHAVPDREVQV
jgi:hypothetical protein